MDRVERRVTGSHHDGVLADVPLGLGAIGHLVGEEVGGRPLAQCWQAVRAGGAGVAPGAGGVDHRACLDAGLVALAVDQVDGEGLLGAVGVDQPVAALARDTGHPGVVPHQVAQRLRERRQVAVDPLSSGRVPGFGGGPPRRCQPPGRRLVDQLRPRREQPYVPPLGHRRRRLQTGLQHQRLQAALRQVRRGSQAQWATTDHDDRQVTHHSLLEGRIHRIDVHLCDNPDARIDRCQWMSKNVSS